MKKTLFVAFICFLSVVRVDAGINNYTGDKKANFDIIELNNEKVFKGKIMKIKDCMVDFKAEGQRYLIPAADIKELYFANPYSSAARKFYKRGKDDNQKCILGATDAEAYHGGGSLYFVLGFLFLFFAFIGPVLFAPKPQNSFNTKTYSKNKQLFDDPIYLDCYKKAARKKQNNSILWGFLTNILLALTIAGTAASV
ncbi:MAG: hypothetical protein MRZ79_03335 [Bacteroidia bacterium]|nr:hypothetical protein [Bacteroidia bacterium]